MHLYICFLTEAISSLCSEQIEKGCIGPKHESLFANVLVGAHASLMRTFVAIGGKFLLQMKTSVKFAVERLSLIDSIFKQIKADHRRTVELVQTARGQYAMCF